MAFIGVYISPDPKYFRLIAGLFLVITSFFMIIREYVRQEEPALKPMPFAAGLFIGSYLGTAKHAKLKYSYSALCDHP
jgi:hypothetical protein